MDNYLKWFDAVTTHAEFKPNYNAAPSQELPIIINEDNQNTLVGMKWGIPRMLGKDAVRELINTRSDKAFSGFWRRTVMERRCLVPANSFFEWQKRGGQKIPFLIRPKEEPTFAFAGIWSEWTDKAGNTYPTYSIMTTEPNKEMSTIHDRMPVILHREDEKHWLDQGLSQNDVASLLIPSEDGRLEMFEVSTEVNNVRNNSANILLKA